MTTTIHTSGVGWMKLEAPPTQSKGLSLANIIECHYILFYTCLGKSPSNISDGPIRNVVHHGVVEGSTIPGQVGSALCLS